MAFPRSELTPALVVLALSTAVFVAGALAGWPGGANACVAGGGCFCEAARPGLVRQPANTWSDLGFILVGLAIGRHAARTRWGQPRPGGSGLGGNQPGATPRDAPALDTPALDMPTLDTPALDARGFGAAAPNRMRAGGLYPSLYAAIVVFMGPGSMYFHASLTRWGGTLDVLSMYFFITFWVVYALARGYDLSKRRFLQVFVGINLLIGIPQVALGHPSAYVFGPLAAVGLILELLMQPLPGRRPAWLPRPAPIRSRWVLLGWAAFAAAFAIWAPSRTGGPWCDPDSLLQGHAAWHLLSAVTTGCFYLYWCSEMRPPSQTANEAL